MPFPETNPIQGKDVILQISDDNEENWYTLVCAEKQGNKQTRDVKQRNTQCGEVVGIAPTTKRAVDFSGVYNVVDDEVVDNLGYASGEKLKQWMDNGTSLIVRQIKDAGEDLINKSKAYISAYNEDIPVDDVVSFDVTFTMWGTWTHTG